MIERKVYRLQFEVDGWRRSLIVRCVDSTQAELNRRVATRWLPAVGLGRHCAGLLGVASDPSAEWVWQIHKTSATRHWRATPTAASSKRRSICAPS
jgi:hypothetical protein